ncbi:MAG: dihydrodipicolinate synthase family protein [Chloroflexota bacterium]|nr:dihydrodipicolinate synthase family protein [Chloroflexota bacterium]
MPNPAPLSGCIPILCTPFHEDGSLDLPGLAREIEYVLGEGASGVAALAIASEGYKLTEAERDAVAEAVVATVAGRVPVVISADGAGTEPALDRARRAVACGADALMVLPPSFVKPGAPDLADYYTAIATAVDVPLIVQDAPQLTGVAMTPALWADLAERTSTLRYVKVEGTPQGEVISAAVAAGGGRLAVFCGWGGLSILDALERGAAGSMPAPNFTRLFAEVQDRYARGDHDVAAAFFAAELPFLLWTMQSVDHSVAAAKEEFRRRGIFASAHQRRPAARLDAIARGQLARFLDRRLRTP